MIALTKLRRLIASKPGQVIISILGMASIVGVLLLAPTLGSQGEYAARVVFGGLMVGCIAYTVSPYVRDRRSGVKTQTLTQAIIARPLVAILTVIVLLTTVAWAALVLRYGLVSDVEAHLRNGLGTALIFLLGFLRAARRHGESPDAQLVSPVGPPSAES